MAQIIKHRRGTLANLSSVTLNNGEIGVVTSSVSNIGDAALKTALVVGHTDGTNRLSVSRLSYGTAVPNLSGITGGSNFNDLMHYDSDNYKLYRLNSGGNTDLDLTGAVAGRALSGSLIVTGVVDFESDIEAQANIDLSGSLFLEDATAAITHEGATGLAISSTSGYVDVESVRFTGTNIGISGDTDLIVPTANTLTVNATTFTLDDNAVVGIDSDTDLMQLASNSVNVRGAISASSFISASALHVEGNIDAEGNITIGGTLTIGDSASDSVSISADVTSNIIPNASDSYNLGSDSQRWNDLYLSGSISASGGNHSIISAGTIDIDADGALTIDGGSVTIGGDSDVAFDIDTSTLDIDSSGAITIDGTSGVSIDAGAASNLSTSAGALTVHGAGGVNLGTTADVAFDVDTSTLDIDSSGAITIDSTAGISLDAAAASNLTTSAGALTLEGFTGINFKESGSNVIAIDTNRDVLFSQTGGSSGDPDVEIDGYLVVDGTAEFNGTVDIDGTVDVDNDTFSVDSSGAISLDAGAASNLTTSAGAITIDAAASTVKVDGHTGVEVTSTNSGNVTIDGKAGVAIQEDGTDVIAIDTNRDVLFSQTGGSTSDPDVEVDGYSRFDGQVEVANTTTSTTTATGALVVDGGAGIAENVNVGGNLTVTGNYTVNGTTTFISSSTLDIADNIISVNSVSPVRYGGIHVMDVNAGVTGSMVWDSTNDYWIAGQSGSEYRVPIQTTVSDLSDNKIVIAQGNGRIESSANITDDGSTVDFNDVDLTSLDKLEGVDTNTYIDLGGSTLIVTKGTIQPATNNGDDLGATGTRYKNLWLQGNADLEGDIDVNGTANLDNTDIDGTLDVSGVADFQARVDAQASLYVTGSVYASTGASMASGSSVAFQVPSSTQLGYMSSANTTAVTAGLVGYNASNGNLTVSSVIDGGSF